MPVIRGEAVVKSVTADQRQKVIEQFEKELAGETTPDGPVIFEIPFQPPDKIDVLVVWNAWEPFDSEERSNLILDAYKERKAKIAQALGVTYQEALEQQALPYSVSPMARQGEVDFEDLKWAMLSEGGFDLGNGKVELRLPTMSLAEGAHRRLSDKLPKGYWGIVQTVGSTPY